MLTLRVFVAKNSGGGRRRHKPSALDPPSDEELQAPDASAEEKDKIDTGGARAGQIASESVSPEFRESPPMNDDGPPKNDVATPPVKPGKREATPPDKPGKREVSPSRERNDDDGVPRANSNATQPTHKYTCRPLYTHLDPQCPTMRRRRRHFGEPERDKQSSPTNEGSLSSPPLSSPSSPASPHSPTSPGSDYARFHDAVDCLHDTMMFVWFNKYFHDSTWESDFEGYVKKRGMGKNDVLHKFDNRNNDNALYKDTIFKRDDQKSVEEFANFQKLQEHVRGGYFFDWHDLSKLMSNGHMRMFWRGGLRLFLNNPVDINCASKLRHKMSKYPSNFL